MVKFEISPRKNKKYKVTFIKHNKTYTIHFGDKRYEHYKDKIGLYSHLDHLDENRRRLFKGRFKTRKNKYGKLLINDKMSPLYWSYHYLW